MNKERYLLGGRCFVPVTHSTVEHDFTFMGLVHEAGLDTLEPAPGEAYPAFAERLLKHAVTSKKTMPMLGCLLIPEGMRQEDWTPALCDETAQFIGRLTSDEDKSKVHQLVLSLLIDFFRTGLIYYASSQTSSPVMPVLMEEVQKP